MLSRSDSNIGGNKTVDHFGQTDIWLICLDLDGNIQWQTVYGGDLAETNGYIIQYTDTSLLFCTESNSSISGNKTVENIGNSDVWLVEIGSSFGQIIQQRSIGTLNDDSFPKIIKSPFNNHIYINCVTDQGVSGDKTEAGFGSSDIWLIELDEDLQIIRNKCFGGSGVDFNGMFFIEEDGLLISASSTSEPSGTKTAPNQGNGSFDGWLFKTDLDLNPIWDKTYGGSSDDYLNQIQKNINGNYVVSAISSSDPVTGNKTSQHFGTSLKTDLWLLILNQNGDILAQETYGGIQDDYGNFYQNGLNHNELVLVSSSVNGISGNKTVPNFGSTQGLPTSDVWVATLDASDFLNTKELNPSNASVSVYPNPFIDELSFRFNQLNEDVTITFYSLEGKQIDSKKIKAGTTDFTWTTPSTFGMVFYEIKGAQSFLSGKVFQE